MPDIVKCAYCGKEYRRFRRDGKFCSDTCRVQNARLPARLKEKADKAIDYIAQMRELAEKYPHLLPQLDGLLLDVQQKATLEWMKLSQIGNLPETKKA